MDLPARLTRGSLLVAAFLFATLVSVCELSAPLAEPATSHAVTVGPALVSQDEGLTAQAALSVLGVADEPRPPGYDRDLFGYRAVDLDRNGCDTRNDILGRDLADIVTKPGTNDCVVVSGTLHDPYTGQTLAFERGAATSADVQIDHVVSLSAAWSSGAWQWDEATRYEFGNDPLNLLAVAGSANVQKGDQAADRWLPHTEYQCAYVARQIAVKRTYDLTVTTPERDAMAVVLSTCPDQPLPLPSPAPAVYYASCAEVRAAGAAPLHRGEPGYRPGLDRNADGVACR